MQILKSLSFVVCALAFTSVSARAQEAADVRSGAGAPQRGYVSAGTGVTLGTDRAATFAVEYADNLGRQVQAYANFSYFDNVINDATRDELRSLAGLMAGLTGSPWEFSGRDRGVAFVAGGKVLVPTGTSVRPYVGAGAGALNVKRTITERTRGDLTSAVISDLGFTDGAFNTADASTTKPMIEGIVGVGIVAGHTYVDVGYRYRKAFHFAAPLDFGQFSVGVGYRF
jgi:opacity protein-like surface antigen